MINGLKYIDNFITLQEQDYLIKIIDESPWDNSLKRRTQHYGYRYDYTKKKIDTSLYVGPLPEYLQKYAVYLLNNNFFKELPDQVIVNEYLPGQGISRHTDCVSCFTNSIASISLGSTCMMEFENIKNLKKGSMMLAPLSLLVLADESRYDWMHSIPPRKEDSWKEEILPRSRRISLTFRKILLT